MAITEREVKIAIITGVAISLASLVIMAISKKVK